MHHRLVISGCLSIALIASCNTQSKPTDLQSKPTDRTQSKPTDRPDMCIFSVAIYQRDDDTGEYKRIDPAIGGYLTVVPSEYFSPKFLPLDFSQKLQLKVSYGQEEKTLTAKPNASHIEFVDGQWRIQITIDATTVSPFSQNEHLLPAPVHLYLTEIYWGNDGKTDAEHIRGRKILKTTEIKDKQLLKKIKSMLVDSENFGLEGAMCFHPRTALSFGSGDSKTEILFCRECSWMYVYV